MESAGYSLSQGFPHSLVVECLARPKFGCSENQAEQISLPN